jgi:serine/threonine-protein kinase
MILYEMLVGTNPFNIDEFELNKEWRYYQSHLKQNPQPIKTQPGGENIPPILAGIVMRCLRKNPRERFSSIKELENKLKQL